MSVTKGSKLREYIVRLRSKAEQLNLEMSFNYDEGAPSIFYATPTSTDRTSYFASLKKSNLQLKGGYSY